jgi:Cdc6-like AAA superfamily ATPase
MKPYTLISSDRTEKGKLIARDLSTKEDIYIGQYKSGTPVITGKFKPEYSTQRMVVYGKSGSGKTTWSSFIISSYHRQFPDNEIILVSPHEKDQEKALAKQLKFVKQLDISEKPEPIDATEEFKHCLVFIDDMKGFKTKEQNAFVFKLANDLIYNCRKYEVSVIISNHELLGGVSNKLMNFEAEQVTFFPQSMLSWRQIETYCKKYLGFDAKTLAIVRQSKSRWITVCTTIPSYIMTEDSIYMV